MTTDARSSPALASTPLPTSPGPVHRKRTWRTIRAWALVVFLAAGGLASVQALFFRKAPVEVRTTAAAYGLVEQTVASTRAGSVRSRRSSDLSADVAGVMESKGQMLGFDLDEMVLIPLRSAMRMFNLPQVQEIHVFVTSQGMIEPAMREIRRILRDRHAGEDDVTLISQADMLRTIDEVLGVVSAGVLVIAAISVLVGAVGILTIQWVAVRERTPEIGLAKAVGASDRQILLMFLSEAAVLAAAGGALGLAVGISGGALLRAVLPAVPVATPAWVPPLALLSAVAVGLAAGVLPAFRAARLDPVEALRSE